MGILLFFTAFLFVFMCAMAIPLLVGVLVYRDAAKRVDCNPWLWALIAALAPSFVGLIIYLIVRSDFPLKEPVFAYDEFGNPIPQPAPGFPKWAKVLLIVFAVLFVVLLLGGCAATMYSIFAYNTPMTFDTFHYSF
jgi:hypothetical protein